MNFQTMSRQRKFIMIAAAAGIISVFLPWVTVSIFGESQSTNGFRSYGIVVFLAFAATRGIYFPLHQACQPGYKHGLVAAAEKYFVSTFRVAPAPANLYCTGLLRPSGTPAPQHSAGYTRASYFYESLLRIAKWLLSFYLAHLLFAVLRYHALKMQVYFLPISFCYTMPAILLQVALLYLSAAVCLLP